MAKRHTILPSNPDELICPLYCTPQQGDFLGYHDLFRGHSIVACHRCGLIFVTPPVTDEELQAYYDSKYWQEIGAVVPSGKPFSYTLFPGATIRAKSQIEFIKESLSVDSFEGWHVLDIGCSPGVLLKTFKDAGAITQGVEPSETFAKYIQEMLGIQVEIGILEQVNLPESHFDLVCMSHVLEHFANPLQVLHKVRGATRPGGIVFIEVPYHTRQDFTGGRATGSHLLFFTPESLNAVATRTGFEIVRMSTCGRPRPNYQVQHPFTKWIRSRVRWASRTGNPAVKIGLHALRRLYHLWKRPLIHDCQQNTLDESIYFCYYDSSSKVGQWIRTMLRAI